MTTERTAVAYLRTSTAGQRNGLEAQEHAVRDWAAREGVAVVAWCRDVGVSGGAPLDRRPALVEALALLPGHALLVVHKRDRLCRDVAVAVVVEREVERAGAAVVSTLGEGTGDSAEARLMRRLFDAVAEYERAMIRARIRRGLDAKRRRGEALGPRAPYGSRVVDGELEDDVDELRAVSFARARRAEGGSLRAIAAELEAAGFRPRGRQWHPETVRRLVAG